MRTTVTLDDDVAQALDQVQNDERVTFRQALNDAVREGLAARLRRARDGEAPVQTTRARPLEPRLTSFDSTSELLALVEGDAYR